MHHTLAKINEILARKDEKIQELEAVLSRRKKQRAELIEENSNLLRELEEVRKVAEDQTSWREAYENMRDFALSKGLDTMTRQQ
jgi:regulator of replication initiation timing